MVILTLQVKCLSLGTSRSTKCFIHFVRSDSGSFRIRAILHGALPHISNLKLVFELFKRVDGLDVKEIGDETGLSTSMSFHLFALQRLVLLPDILVSAVAI